MKNIKAFIDLIDDNLSPINKEIKDDIKYLREKIDKMQ